MAPLCRAPQSGNCLKRKRAHHIRRHPSRGISENGSGVVQSRGRCQLATSASESTGSAGRALREASCAASQLHVLFHLERPADDAHLVGLVKELDALLAVVERNGTKDDVGIPPLTRPGHRSWIDTGDEQVLAGLVAKDNGI